MVQAVAAYPSKAFYGDTLCNTVLASAPPRNFLCDSQPASMVFINVDEAKEEKRRSSFWSPSEIEEVVKVVKEVLAGEGVKPEDMALISPYAP